LERYLTLISVIAAHRNGDVYGRTRLQKTVKLLQSAGLKTGYPFMSYFYGPYSEDLQADLRTLQHSGFLTERPEQSQDGSEYYVMSAMIDPAHDEVAPFQPIINRLATEPTVVLELAATFQSFKELGLPTDEATVRTRQKKGVKCGGGNLEHAMAVLAEIGLHP
jgi:uncharacterized protein YwgA